MDILETILPIISIALAGFGAVRFGYLSQADCDGISKFVFMFIIPALLFVGTVKAKIPADMDWSFLAVYYFSVLFVYLVAVIVAAYWFGYNHPEQSVFGMASCYSNATIVGIPICIYALGEASMLPLFILVSIHNLVLFTLGVLVAERSKLSFSAIFSNIYSISKDLLKSPITSSLVLGGLVNVLDLPLYAPLEGALTLASEAAVPSALFVLGASLYRYKIQGNILPAIVVIALKMILLPVLVWWMLFYIFPIDPLWASTAVLTAAMPVGISVYIFTQKYHAAEAQVATAIVLSTIFSVVSLSVLMIFIGVLPD